MNGKDETRRWTKVIVPSVEFADVVSCDTPHLFRISANICGQRVAASQNTLVQIMVAALFSLIGLFFVVDRSAFGQHRRLCTWVCSDTKVIELPLCFGVREIWMVKGVKPRMKQLKKAVHSRTRGKTVKVEVSPGRRRGLAQPQVSQKSEAPPFWSLLG